MNALTSCWIGAQQRFAKGSREGMGNGFLAKADALFVGLRVSASYHEALKVAGNKSAALKAARLEMRNAIRAAGLRIKFEDRLWESAFAAKPSASRPDVRPKFRTQGSCAYDLLVDPCHRPAQQLDLDDGMYVVVDFLQGKPSLAAKSLFMLVEEALRPLCEKRGWKLNDTKDTCVRVEISHDSHIDIPIYSAPRDVAEALAFDETAFAAVHLAKRAGTHYTRLPSDQIMLAHRDGTWEPSDPLKLHDWVDACVTRYGEDFRRACRYLKGWRDYQWEHCCLSSITIMASVAKALALLRGAHKSFPDDRLIYEIAQLLPGIFEGEITNPAFPEKHIILNDWSDADRRAVVAAARTLAENMESALKRTAVQSLVVDALRRAFGDRIPYRPDAVEILPATVAAVTGAKPATVPAPRVTNSTSG